MCETSESDKMKIPNLLASHPRNCLVLCFELPVAFVGYPIYISTFNSISIRQYIDKYDIEFLDGLLIVCTMYFW
jgi:hypothetical protein